jgi:16S rRNA processing protein RimM
MNLADLHTLGTITKLHGYKGELTADIGQSNVEEYKDLTFVFIERKGEIVPFPITTIEYKTNRNIKLKLEGVDNEVAARPLVGCKILIRTEDISTSDRERMEFSRVIGYTVIDSEHGDIGKVASIEDKAMNPLMSIDGPGGEILLPLHPDFFDEINDEKKTVYITAPEGLINFYLGR